MMLVKGAGSQSFPAPAHTAPQCGSADDFHRGQKMPFGVGFGVIEVKNTGKAPYFKEIVRAAAGVAATFYRNGGYIMPEENKNKKKFPLWIYPETREMVIDW